MYLQIPIILALAMHSMHSRHAQNIQMETVMMNVLFTPSIGGATQTVKVCIHVSNPQAAEPWDQDVATYVGLLEGPDGTGQRNLF
jgi:hypothetical protein